MLPFQAQIEEKRRHPRLAKTLPIKIKPTRYSGFFETTTQNISKGGMMINLNLDNSSHLSSVTNLDIEFNLPLAKFPLKSKAKIIWVAKSKAGIRFVEIRPAERRIVSLFIQKELKLPIKSELVTYQNRRNKTVIGFFDHLEDEVKASPFIIVPPVYGETKTNSLSMAYYLVSNGFNVIRYDNTNHIGESDGEIFNFTLPRAKEDLIATLDFVQNKFKVNQVGVVARCLATKIALRAATQDKRIKFLLSLVGIVDLQSTLQFVYQKDIIGTFLENKDRGWYSADVLGFEVHRRFPITAIKEKYHNLGTSIKDASKLRIPFVYLFAENDSWVKLEDIMKVIHAIRVPKHEFFVIPEAVHMLYENPSAAKFAFRQIIASCNKYLLSQHTTLEEVVEPSIRQIALQSCIEKQRLKKHDITEDQEKKFWSDYLTKYILIDKSPEYRNYLDMLVNILGEPEDGEMVLDAGCGNGPYGAWLLRRLFNRQALPSYVYVGIDFVENALREALKKHSEIKKELEKESFKEGSLKIVYVAGNLKPGNHFDSRRGSYICFKDDTFDKICCSFVIPFVKEPLKTLKELIRVLKPHGKIVVSSLKPYADLSEIYRKFVEKTDNEEEIEEARQLLSAAGKIKAKELEGHYRFFDKDELGELLRRAGGKNIYLYRSFANQSNIAVAEKLE